MAGIGEPYPDVPGWDLEPPWLYEPLTFQRDTLSDRGDPRAPDYGPGYELSAGEPRPAQHELTFGYHDQGGWSEDQMTGVHGVIGAFDPNHSGYQEGWGVEPTIARNAPTMAWDAGISVVPVGGI